MKKKLISLLLCMTLVAGLLPSLKVHAAEMPSIAGTEQLEESEEISSGEAATIPDENSGGGYNRKQ